MTVAMAEPAASKRCGRLRAGQRCAQHVAPREPQKPAEILEGVYSPGLIAFWHVPTHYIALIALARGDTSSDEAQYLHYEWSLIREGYRSQLARQRKLSSSEAPHCLCMYLHGLSLLKPGGAYPLEQSARGGTGDAHGRSARVQADLEQAADALPMGWFATRKVFAVQQRSLALFARIGDVRTGRTLPRAQDQDREPAFGGYDIAMKRMATSLGWSTT